MTDIRSGRRWHCQSTRYEAQTVSKSFLTGSAFIMDTQGLSYLSMSTSANTLESLQLTSPYWRGLTRLTVTRLASLMAINGLVSSLLFSLLAMDLIFTPMALGVTQCHLRRRRQFVCGIFYGSEVPGLLANIGFFVFSYKFWKKTIKKSL